MSAGTRSTALLKDSIYAALAKRRRKNTGSPQKAQGLEELEVTVGLLTTDMDDVGDNVALFQFPDNCRLWGLSLEVDDLDTHATPTIKFDIALSAVAAGTSQTVLIDDSTAAQGGGVDGIDALTYLGYDVSNKYLCFQCAAAGTTRVAGDITIHALVYLTDPATAQG